MEREGQNGVDRCLLLVPRGYDAPLDLLDGLRRWGVAVSEVSDEPAVMVALARGAVTSLVIVEPSRHPNVAALTHAVNRYHTAVVLWRYEWSFEPRLTRFASVAAAPAPDAATVPVPAPAATSAPSPIEPAATPKPAAMPEHVSPPPSSASGLVMDPPPPTVAEPEDELEILPPDDNTPLTSPNYSPVTLTRDEITMLLDEGPAPQAQR